MARGLDGANYTAPPVEGKNVLDIPFYRTGRYTQNPWLIPNERNEVILRQQYFRLVTENICQPGTRVWVRT